MTAIDHHTSLAQGVKVIKSYVKVLTGAPGVYRMLNINNEVLYVGKARNLKKRVANYTLPQKLPLRLQRMIAETVHMEFSTTHTEVEALLLEANLIKKFRPRYNILLKDGKSFVYITLDKSHSWPRLAKERALKREKDIEYYGPFASVEAVDTTLTSLYRAFQLRSCADTVFANRKRPCLQYHIKQCSAPCVGWITAEDYKRDYQSAKEALLGRSNKVQKLLADSMQEASNCQDYERAAIYRDRLRALAQIQAQQTINIPDIRDVDVIALAQEAGITCIHVFFYRNGSNYGSYSFFPTHSTDAVKEDIMSAFLTQFYEGREPPPRVLLNCDMPNFKVVQQALNVLSSRRVELKIPKLGKKKQLLDHALANAQMALTQRLATQARQRAVLEEIMQLFNLNHLPQRIEVYDNSHTQGQSQIGAMIVAGPEGFIKPAYRKFNIKAAIAPGDDYAMMREVLQRRFKRAISTEDGEKLPDLVIIDGGKGQLRAAEDTLEDLGCGNLPLLAISKGPQRKPGEEQYYLRGGQPLPMVGNSALAYYFQRIRDEAHRFAIGTHRKKRQKQALGTSLDEIPGVGAKRKQALLRHFGSAINVKRAGIGDLENVEGISAAIAKQIYSYFHVT